MTQAIARIQSITGSSSESPQPEIWNGETGWPTDGGTDYGDAVASTDNAETYFKTGVCGLLAWNVNVFYFEAFDEPNKVDSVGDDGNAAVETVWGAYTAEREPKFDLSC